MEQRRPFGRGRGMGRGVQREPGYITPESQSETNIALSSLSGEMSSLTTESDDVSGVGDAGKPSNRGTPYWEAGTRMRPVESHPLPDTDEDGAPRTAASRGSSLERRITSYKVPPLPESPMDERSAELLKVVGDEQGHIPGDIPKRGGHRAVGVEPGNWRNTIQTRSKTLESKVGKNGKSVELMSNYFKLIQSKDWTLYNIPVRFSPPVDEKNSRRWLIRQISEDIAPYVWDGANLFTVNALCEKGKQRTWTIPDPKTASNVTISMEDSYKIPSGDPQCFQLYNLIIRKCMLGMKLEELGRHFYDPNQEIFIKEAQLRLWPGFITSMRPHERDVLMCVEITHKVLRAETAYDIVQELLREHGRDPKGQQRISDELVGQVVLTTYGNKTASYRIDDVKWSMNPMATFEKRVKGEKGAEPKTAPISFAQYMLERYNMKVNDTKQPLLVSKPKKKTIHSGEVQNVLLIPEFCQMTGLTDRMRANFNLMKSLATHLHQGPGTRIGSIKKFINSLHSTDELVKELKSWDMRFDKELITFPGRILNRETILFGNGGTEAPNQEADWTMGFRKQKLFSVVNMNKWVLVSPFRERQAADTFVMTMQKVGKPIDMQIVRPLEVVTVGDVKPVTYIKEIKNVIAKHKNDLQMVFVVLPNNKTELYNAVKKCLGVDYGIPSQCFLSKNVQKNNMSVATKGVIQMSAKIGGEPWSVKLPLKDLMVVGFDVYHDKSSRGKTVGAMVASMSPTLAKYYSLTSYHSTDTELSNNMADMIIECCQEYKKVNGSLPKRIILYRDGVSDGQVDFVVRSELQTIISSLESHCKAAEADEVKLTFIICTKRINTRLFIKQENPPPGTVCDDVVTLPERYDFFLIAQFSKQGTVSPVNFNVIHDTNMLDPDKVQILTFKMCHMYFNWSGTVPVPAQCQYAHKLAYLTGTAFGNQANLKLSNLLHFL